MRKKKSPPKLAEKREQNVTKSWIEALARREEWQKTQKSRIIRIYKLEVPDKDHVFVVAPGRVEAAGFVALVLGLVSEPIEQPDELAAMKQHYEELGRSIAERERLMDSPE